LPWLLATGTGHSSLGDTGEWSLTNRAAGIQTGYTIRANRLSNIQAIQYRGDDQLFEWYLMTTRLQDNINLASLTDTAKRFSFRLEHTRGQDRNLTHKTLLHC
jgi:hypothetical protein